MGLLTLALLAQMPLPGFTIGIVLCAVACAILFRIWFFYSDPGKEMGRAEISLPLNLYRIAYLRGGENEVIRVVLLYLIDLGLIKPTPHQAIGLFRNKKGDGHVWQRDSSIETPKELNALELKILDYFAGKPKSIKSIYRRLPPFEREVIFKDYKDWGMQQHFLISGERRTAKTFFLLVIGIILELFVLYIFVFTAQNELGKFLLFLTLFIIPIILLMGAVTSRITWRGKQYLIDLSTVYRSFSNLDKDPPQEVPGDSLVPRNASSEALAFSLFGVAAIANGKHREFAGSVSIPGEGSCGVGGFVMSDSGNSCSGGGCSGDGGCSGGGCGGCGGD